MSKDNRYFASLISILVLAFCFILAACSHGPATPIRSSLETAAAKNASSVPSPFMGEIAMLPQTDITPQPPEESRPSISTSESTTQIQESTIQTREDASTQSREESSLSLTMDFSMLEYEKNKITFREKKSDFENFSISRMMRTVMVNGREYCFELSSSEEDCSERVRFTEELLIKAGITKELRICLFGVVKHTYIEDGCMYGGISNMSDIEYVTAVLLAAYGEFANYGMAYGYAGLLLEEEIAEGKYPLDWDFYDLNLLCFSPAFCGEEELNNVKAIALDFATEYVAKNGHAAYQDLLSKSGQLDEAEEARQALLIHYNSRGVDPVLSPLLYAMGGTTYSHIMRCEYATFYIERDWEDKDLDKIYNIDGWEAFNFDIIRSGTSYKAYRNVFESLRMEMKQYQDLFDLYPYKNQLPVFLVNNEKMSSPGYYNPHLHQIYLATLPKFSHEYIHAVTYFNLKTTTRWIVEGLATYYSTRFSSYSNALYVCIVEAGNDCGPEMIQVSERYLDALGRRFNPTCDTADYMSLITYFYGHTVYDDPYGAGAAFIDYLITCFGEREVLDYFLVHHKLSRFTDKSMEELMDDWKTFIDERFKDYEKAEG